MRHGVTYTKARDQHGDLIGVAGRDGAGARGERRGGGRMQAVVSHDEAAASAKCRRASR